MAPTGWNQLSQVHLYGAMLRGSVVMLRGSVVMPRGYLVLPAGWSGRIVMDWSPQDLWPGWPDDH